MNTRTMIVTAAAAFFLLSAGVNTVLAEQDTAGQQGTATETSTMSDHHDGIDSGRDFGQHVSEHNDHFSGDHNPGDHRGFSGIK